MPSEIVLTLSIVLIVILAAAIAFAVGHTLSKRTSAEHARLAQADTERILEEARTRQKELVLEAERGGGQAQERGRAGRPASGGPRCSAGSSA